jgi:hypothetical protein
MKVIVNVMFKGVFYVNFYMYAFWFDEFQSNTFFQAANKLQTQYTNTAQDLNSRYNLTTQAQSRAELLKKRADKLATDTTAKLKKLTG